MRNMILKQLCLSSSMDTMFDDDKYTILIVDDNEQIIDRLRRKLSDEYNVYYAYNGLDALNTLEVIPRPDVILCDICMEVMGGFEFYKKLLKNKEYHSVPFIFVTGMCSENCTLKALNMGAVDVIEKPFLTGTIKAKLSSIIDIQVSKELEVIENINKYRKLQLQNKQKDLHITPSERKVIDYVLNGCENKEIASLLNIKERTVKFHLGNVYRKCNVQNRIELINFMSGIS